MSHKAVSPAIVRVVITPPLFLRVVRQRRRLLVSAQGTREMGDDRLSLFLHMGGVLEVRTLWVAHGRPHLQWTLDFGVADSAVAEGSDPPLSAFASSRVCC